VYLVYRSFIIFFITLHFLPPWSVFAETSENTVSAILTAKVTTTVNPLGEQGTPIRDARIIVINLLGEIIATELTNSQGEAIIPVTVPKDPRFPTKNMGEVTIIAVAKGYNEHINFSVPINEFNDHTGRVLIPLWQIDPKKEEMNRNFSMGNITGFLFLKCLIITPKI
jgi:hypothetical protein